MVLYVSTSVLKIRFLRSVSLSEDFTHAGEAYKRSSIAPCTFMGKNTLEKERGEEEKRVKEDMETEEVE